ncbi:hypothetical protein FOA43_003949 [Brettanomyces nanus]|uniref:Response regulatory domain-containing protein n=1 Tax=Eeniella nana TaxID=13502 RepID=A0A875SAF3_EENNA|nr:uncharacterized protein FOA43_003949 [Brettanomyces nanus]QPG76559.1 hypothetical protein FOA43_003949 [Brettanomyces nanus]
MFGLHQKKPVVPEPTSPVSLSPTSSAIGGILAGGRIADSYGFGLRPLPGARHSFLHKGFLSNGIDSLELPTESPMEKDKQKEAANAVARSSSSLRTPESRRIWVRRMGKTPTAIIVGPDTIVDDIKYIVTQKFPTSLALECDPSELNIIAELPASSKSIPVSANLKGLTQAASSSISSPTSLNSVASTTPVYTDEVSRMRSLPTIRVPNEQNTSSTSSAVPSSSLFSSSFSTNPSHDNVNRMQSSNAPLLPAKQNGIAVGHRIALEPDLLVYLLLDTYYPNGMSMQDALIIESPKPVESSTAITDFNIDSTARNLQKHGGGKASSPFVFESSAVSSSKNAIHGGQPLKSPRDSSVLRKRTNISEYIPTPPSSTVILFPKPARPDLKTPIPDGSNSTILSLDKSKGKTPKEAELSSTTPTPVSASSKTLKNTVNDLRQQPNPGISKILSHINVLVVEDNLVNQKIMARHLKSCKVGFKIATTGKEALEMWREGGFHLCFMDIQLPVMSGIEVTQEIRRLEKLNRIGNFATSSQEDKLSRDTPELTGSDRLDLDLFRSPIIIVALTASTSAEDKQKALAAGCNDYLTKPVQLKWLRSKLTEWGCMQALINYDYFRKDF